MHGYSREQSGAANKAVKAVVGDISKLFHLCADGEWISAEDAKKKTLNHRLLASVMQDYIMRVSIDKVLTLLRTR